MHLRSALRWSLATLSALLAVAEAGAQIHLATPGSGPFVLPGGNLGLAGAVIDNEFVADFQAPLAREGGPVGQSPGAFAIEIIPDAGLQANPAALAAFQRAAQQWAARITDPVTITIEGRFQSLGANILGATQSVALFGGYNDIRDAMVTDAAGDFDDAIVSRLPTLAEFSAYVPDGRALGEYIVLSKANAKALGFTGLDSLFGLSDGSITFSSDFAFDFDNRDGVGAGLIDFETVAAHEIGHALGFTSIVDAANNGAATLYPFTLDLFRFGRDPAYNPVTEADFTLTPRMLVPGIASVTDQISGPIAEWGMSTGLPNAAFPGTDGRQASHWLDGDLSGELLGLMDPTLGFGEAYGPSEADFRAFDLLGYDIAPIPEPSTACIGLAVGLSVCIRRRRAASRR